jgi:hypothetical protein
MALAVKAAASTLAASSTAPGWVAVHCYADQLAESTQCGFASIVDAHPDLTEELSDTKQARLRQTGSGSTAVAPVSPRLPVREEAPRRLVVRKGRRRTPASVEVWERALAENPEPKHVQREISGAPPGRPVRAARIPDLSPIHGVTSLPVTWRPSYCDPDNRLTN